MNSTSPELERSLSLSLLTFYGLGSILGAGIYVLIGKVVATAGIFTPWSFLIASLIAGYQWPGLPLQWHSWVTNCLPESWRK
jgi:amino acid transporter